MKRFLLLIACSALLLDSRAEGQNAPAGEPKPDAIPWIVDDHLDQVQGEIVALKTLSGAEAAAADARFRALALEYLAAFEGVLCEGGAAEISSPVDDWRGAHGAQALRMRIAADLRLWHPIFALVFVESVVRLGPRGSFALMVEGSATRPERAIQVRKTRLAADGPRDRAVLDRVAAQVQDEMQRLWRALGEIVSDEYAGIVQRALETNPPPAALDVVARVAALTSEIFASGRCAAIVAALREPPRSAALSGAFAAAAQAQMAAQTEDVPPRVLRFARLLRLLVLLNTRESMDALLLGYEPFAGATDRASSPLRPFEDALVAATSAFIGNGPSAHSDERLGLEVIDQLTRWLLTHVERSGDELRGACFVRALYVVQLAHAGAFERYMVRFYRDFHALDPSGYEAVIFHLVGILAGYAATGLYLESDPLPGAAPKTGPVPTHEMVMELLRAYNTALSEVGPSIPKVNYFFINEAQRAEVREVLAVFRLRAVIYQGKPQLRDPRLVETLLMLIRRVAHAWDPDEIREFVLAPFEEIAGGAGALDQSAALATTQSMRDTLEFLRDSVERRRARL